MATKSFNDICVEYAHQLGKGLPLTAPEMCNAVIMYLNAQITEMQSITTALQTAVAEAESSATEAINKAEDVSETVNALPKVPTPTTSDNGKVIGVQSGAYALVEQGGSAPSNMVTTNTNQSITSIKFFTNGGLRVGDSNAYTIYEEDAIRVCTTTPSLCYRFSFPTNSGLLALFSDIPNLDSYHDTIHIVGSPSYGLAVHDSPNLDPYTKYGYGKIETYGNANALQFKLNIPRKNGILAILDDIPNLDDYTGTVHIVQGTAGSGIAVHDTVNASPYTKYGYDKIETYGNSNALKYTLNIPNKNGTIATLDDISSTPSPVKYFTRVIYHSTDEDTQYVIFSCITDTDLSANTSYQNVIDLLNNLGATSNETALPCTGKTVSGGILVGVYTDGSNIIVFDTDNTPEELTVSSEIKFISK